MREGLEDMREEKENLCEERLKLCQKNKTSKWTMIQLEKVLSGLKINKSRDPYGLANDLFISAGSDMKEAILLMMNLIKEEQIYPEMLENCDISAF